MLRGFAKHGDRVADQYVALAVCVQGSHALEVSGFELFCGSRRKLRLGLQIALRSCLGYDNQERCSHKPLPACLLRAVPNPTGRAALDDAGEHSVPGNTDIIFLLHLHAAA